MKVKIIETGQIKTVLRSVGQLMISEGYAVAAEHEQDPEQDIIRQHIGVQEEKKTQRHVIEVTHRHIVEEEE